MLALLTASDNIGVYMGAPVKAFRNFGLDVAIWETRNGGYSITWRKSYKDKTSGEYKETKTLFPNDAKLLIELLQQAISFCEDNQQPSSQPESSDDGVPF
jgi:hypothetical protein